MQVETNNLLCFYISYWYLLQYCCMQFHNQEVHVTESYFREAQAKVSCYIQLILNGRAISVPAQAKVSCYLQIILNGRANSVPAQAKVSCYIQLILNGRANSVPLVRFLRGFVSRFIYFDS